MRLDVEGLTEVIVGDLADLESLMTALQGVEAVFYVGTVFVPNEVQMGPNMIQAAGRAWCVLTGFLVGNTSHSEQTPVSCR